ncbi:hypothetical protein WR25_20620 isoform B [Diploscapter pachys]|uniref:receptor protein-tyrosine kinase n=1 Tax=Diploscapter pachys TaxID=2018661 RepID=A0A2A2KZX0_9BILA|nr:hypothetical protein WR25_20620 isoform B [Diploscapter pachys]
MKLPLSGLWLLIFHIWLPHVLAQAKNETAKAETPKPVLRKFCSGTSNCLSNTNTIGIDKYTQLSMIYKGCKRIYGNIEITHVETKNNDSLDWSIFDDIEEVKGSVIIFNTDLQNVSFKNLRIIWGEQNACNHSVFISTNNNLKFVSMPKLRVINKKPIYIVKNPYMCYLNKIKWQELIDDDTSRLYLENNSEKCSDKKSFACDASCPSTSIGNSSKMQHCWFRGAKHCQDTYRTNCHCPGGCYKDPKDGQPKCCDSSCLGGCYGDGPTKCLACKEVNDDGVCRATCPKPKQMDFQLGQLVDNPDGKYTHFKYCVKECPEEMLIDDYHCVRHCMTGKAYDAESDSRECKPCNGNCPKICRVNQPINGLLLKNLTGCYEIDGYIDISEHYMSVKKNFTIKDLDVLKSVRVVSEWVRLQVQSAGEVLINDNIQLCYADTINWTGIVTGKPIAKNDTRSMVRIMKNQDKRKCESRMRKCDSNCDSRGCWGPGPKNCVACQHWKLKDECVQKCPEHNYYQNATTKECLPCESRECKLCTGPTAEECKLCYHVSIFEESRMTCLPECPESHYQRNDSTCEKCHDACYKHGCTGSGSSFGNGGCKKCEYALINHDNDKPFIEKCLIMNNSALDLCEQYGLNNYYATAARIEGAVELMCEKCDDECKNCTSSGRNVKSNGCACKHWAMDVQNDETCIEECKGPYYTVKDYTMAPNGLCKKCHELCDQNQDQACTDGTSAGCTECKIVGIKRRSNVTDEDYTECLSECPGTHPYIYNKLCSEVDIQGQLNLIYHTIAAILIAVFLFLGICVLMYFCRYRKTKRKLQIVELDNCADIPEMSPIDPTIRPNLNKLNLIATSELEMKTGKILGQGAFGVVYAGYWMPKEKKHGIRVPVAIKVVKDARNFEAEDEMLSEAMKMCQLRHEHLLRIIGICFHEDAMKMVTLLRPLGNLLSFLKKHRTNLGGRELLLYCYQISSAMKYLYERRVVHRDLAARNVLVKDVNRIEVADFGLSKILEHGKNTVLVETGKVAVKWLAIESLTDQIYNHATDVWAFGVTCWEILTFGQSPYQGMDLCGIRSFLRDGNRLAQPPNCSSELYQELLRCWMSNPDSRPTFVMLNERFHAFCTVPNLYYQNEKPNQDTVETGADSQTELLRELLEDTDFENPLDYFDSQTVPSSPTDSEVFQMPRVRATRLPSSSSSHRYQTDPCSSKAINNRQEVSMDDSNYLVPNAKNQPQEGQTTMYTPVVVNENGLTGKQL